MKQKCLYLHTRACTKRNIDAKKISNYFIKNNFNLANDPKDADYIIFVTCGYTRKMQTDCFHLIKKFKKYNAELIISGCLPAIAKDELKEVFDGRVIPTKNMEIIDEIFPDNKIKWKDIKDKHTRQSDIDQSIPVSIRLIFDSLLTNFLFFKKIHSFLRDSVIYKIFGKTSLTLNAFFPIECFV